MSETDNDDDDITRAGEPDVDPPTAVLQPRSDAHRYCMCQKPFLANPVRPGTSRPYPMLNRWPECRACGRLVRREQAEWMEDMPVKGSVQ